MLKGSIALDENELIKKIQTGDVQAFKQLFELYRESVFNLCFRFANNGEEAEDLCQDVFVKIFRAVSSFRFKSKPATWIYRITVNRCLNYKRKHESLNWLSIDNPSSKNDVFTEEEFQSKENHPQESIEQREREQIVMKAIKSLPKNQQVALVLQRYQEMTVKEIADVTGCSVASVQSRLARAKENLYKKLKPYLDDLI